MAVLGIGGETAESYVPARELLARSLDRLPLEHFVSHRLSLEQAQYGVELAQREEAMLFRVLATLRVEPSLLGSVDELEWRGPTADFPSVCNRIDASDLLARAMRTAGKR